MSNISFPQHNGHPPSPSGSSSISQQQHHTRKPSFYPASFDPDASQGAFQINPNSYHPPRTPRSSIIGNESSYLPQPYNGLQDQPPLPNFYQEEMPVKREENLSQAESAKPSKIRQQEIWKDIIATTAGRDKTLVSLMLK
jgi:hypothetical protein